MNRIKTNLFFYMLSISFGLQAMEKSGIKDVYGDVLSSASQEYKILYEHCNTLKNMQKGFYALEDPDFKNKNIPSFVTETNLVYLAKIIDNPTLIEQESCPNTIFELFKLADYLQAPEKTLGSLAIPAYNHATTLYNKPLQFSLEHHIKAGYHPTTKMLLERAQRHSMKKLVNIASFHLPFYPNFAVFLHDYPVKKILKLFEHYENSCDLNLSAEALKKELGCTKKIASLEGIEALSKISLAPNVTHITASNQYIESVNIGSLAKAFPALRNLNLSRNQLKKLTRKSLRGLPPEFNLDLSKNKITEIEEACFDFPSALKKVKINLNDNPLACMDNKIFNQSYSERIKTLIKSLSAKSLIAFGSLRIDKENIGILLGGLRVITAKNIPSLHMAIEEILSGIAPNFDAVILDRELIHKSEIVSISTQSRWMDSIARCAGAICILAGILFIYSDIQDNYINNLDQAIARDSYRIKVESDTKPIEFPSNYTYRLFGKS